MHYEDGLKGPLVIKPVHDSHNFDSEITVQLTDWYHDSSINLSSFYLSGKRNPDGEEPVFNSGLINGKDTLIAQKQRDRVITLSGKNLLLKKLCDKTSHHK